MLRKYHIASQRNKAPGGRLFLGVEGVGDTWWGMRGNKDWTPCVTGAKTKDWRKEMITLFKCICRVPSRWAVSWKKPNIILHCTYVNSQSLSNHIKCLFCLIFAFGCWIADHEVGYSAEGKRCSCPCMRRREELHSTAAHASLNLYPSLTETWLLLDVDYPAILAAPVSLFNLKPFSKLIFIFSKVILKPSRLIKSND